MKSAFRACNYHTAAVEYEHMKIYDAGQIYMVPSIHSIYHFHLVDVFMRMSDDMTCLLATDISLLNDRQGEVRNS